MFFKYMTKIISIMFVLCFLWCMSDIPALGQILPYSQPYLPFFSNTYIPPYLSINPYIGLYPPLPYFLNRYSPVNINPLYSQASVAGILIPFTSPYANPLAPLYNVAAVSYLPAAVIPVDVSGTWTGVWVSTFLVGGITTGDLSMTLAQSGTDVTGTTAFFLNKILKFGADVVGTVEGNILTLTSTVVPSPLGLKSFDVTITATVNAASMDGTYLVINNVTGLVREEGTFTATRL